MSATATMPAYVPVTYRPLVLEAAAGTGLPVPVVAAQANMESGFQAGAVSSAGAQGWLQFMPSTWASQGVPGSPFDPAAATKGYIRLMGSLLHSYGGDVRKALAAYNAGPGNLAAGYGYADTILKNAGAPSNLSSSSPGRTLGTVKALGDGSSSSSTAPGGVAGFLLRALLTFALLGAGLLLAWEGVNGLLGGAPRKAARTAAIAAVL